MVIVCSAHTPLVTRSADLFAKSQNVKQLLDCRMLKRHAAAPCDLLIIDLEHCGETVIPSMTTPAVALTSVPDYHQAMHLLRKGIRAYGNRHMHPENLLQAATAAQTGQIWLPPSLLARMISSVSETPAVEEAEPPLTEPLSKREEEVAQQVAKGLSNKEIADTMFISVRTVKAHLTSIFAKTGYRDRLELAVNMKSAPVPTPVKKPLNFNPGQGPTHIPV